MRKLKKSVPYNYGEGKEMFNLQKRPMTSYNSVYESKETSIDRMKNPFDTAEGELEVPASVNFQAIGLNQERRDENSQERRMREAFNIIELNSKKYSGFQNLQFLLQG